MNKFNGEARTNLTVIASNNLNEGAFQTNRHGIEATSSHYYSISTRWDGAKRVQLSLIEYVPWPSVYVGLNVFPGFMRKSREYDQRKSFARGICIDSTLECSIIGALLIPSFCNSDISGITIDIHIRRSRICM